MHSPDSERDSAKVRGLDYDMMLHDTWYRLRTEEFGCMKVFAIEGVGGGGCMVFPRTQG